MSSQKTEKGRKVGIAEAVHTLLMSDAMTGNDEGTPTGYYVDAENVEYLVRTVIDAYEDALKASGVIGHLRRAEPDDTDW